jgi:hypothetical protein
MPGKAGQCKANEPVRGSGKLGNLGVSPGRARANYEIVRDLEFARAQVAALR